MNRLVIGCWAVFFCLGLAVPMTQAEPTENKAAAPTELSGNFTSPDGAALEVFQPSAGGDIMLQIDDPGVAKIELTVPAAARQSSPVGMRTQTQFGEAPLELLGAGAELYGRTEVDHEKLEFLVGPDGVVRTFVAGKPIKSPTRASEIEAVLIAQDFAATWASIRSMSISMDPAGVTVRGAQPPGFTQRIDRVFARTANLSEDRKKQLEQTRVDRGGMLGQMDELRRTAAE